MKFNTKFWNKINQDIPGWMSKNEAKFLVDNIQGDVYVEIGVAYGKSMSIVEHHFPDMAITGIEKINHGLNKKVIYGDANEKYIDFQDSSIDTLFIDGDHTYEGVLSDIIHWYNKVKPGGRIIFHDYGRDYAHEGVARGVNIIKPFLKAFKKEQFICAGIKGSN